MRGFSALLVLATGCTFASGVNPFDGNVRPQDGGPGSDGPPSDGMPPDGPMVWMDASNKCLMHATTTDAVSGHHYFVTSVKDRDAAQVDCALFDGHLVKIETSLENALVTSLIPVGGTGYVWIGLHDPTATDVYVWADGSALGGYNAFSGMNPPISSSDCVNSNGQWVTYDCTNTNRGVCECE